MGASSDLQLSWVWTLKYWNSSSNPQIVATESSSLEWGHCIIYPFLGGGTIAMLPTVLWFLSILADNHVHRTWYNMNYFSASYANVLTILSFSLERYLAICRPLYVFPLSDLKRAALVSSLCWVIAMLASIPHLIFTRYTINLYFSLHYLII